MYAAVATGLELRAVIVSRERSFAGICSYTGGYHRGVRTAGGESAERESQSLRALGDASERVEVPRGWLQLLSLRLAQRGVVRSCRRDEGGAPR